MSSCYTQIEKYYNHTHESIIARKFPESSNIDNRLIGQWKKTSILTDVGLGTELLSFYKNGNVIYKVYFNDYLVDDYQGEFRNRDDTLFIRIYPQKEIEKLTFGFNNKQLFLMNLDSPYSDHHNTIKNYPSSDQFVYESSN